MIDYRSILIVITFFSLWISVYFSTAVENFLAYFLILSFGIFHGANDLRLIERKQLNYKGVVFTKVLSTYLLFIGLTASIFFLFPVSALSLFIVFSSFHFGEEHLSIKINKSFLLSSLIFTVYGLFIFALLFYCHQIEVIEIIHQITKKIIPAAYFSYYLMSCTGLLSLFIILAYKTLSLKLVDLIEELFYLFVLYIIFKTASLIWSFAIYFVFWHSIPSLIRQVKYLYGNHQASSFKSYFKTSFLYWFISIIGLVVIYFIFNNNLKLFTPILFILLACITFPHVWIISRLGKDY